MVFHYNNIYMYVYRGQHVLNIDTKFSFLPPTLLCVYLCVKSAMFVFNE